MNGTLLLSFGDDTGSGPRFANTIWLANLLVAAVLTAVSITSVSTAATVTGTTAIVGTVLLLATLLPSSLRRFERFAHSPTLRGMARYRRDLGISSGLWLVSHSVVAVIGYFDLSRPILAQFSATDIVLGTIATLVFVALLVTSNALSVRLLGANWNRLHRLIWFSLPLAVAHTLLSSKRFGGEIEIGPSALLSIPIVLVAIEWLDRRDSVGVTHRHLIGLGAVVTAGFLALDALQVVQ